MKISTIKEAISKAINTHYPVEFKLTYCMIKFERQDAKMHMTILKTKVTDDYDVVFEPCDEFECSIYIGLSGIAQCVDLHHFKIKQMLIKNNFDNILKLRGMADKCALNITKIEDLMQMR